MEVKAVNNGAYTLISIDVAEYSTVFARPQSVTLSGTRSDGSIVTTTFTTDGIIDGTGPLNDFQTFYLPDTFRDIVSLTTDNIIALDNLVLSTQRVTPAAPTVEISTAISLKWKSEVGVSYRLQSSTDLVDWTDFGPLIQGDGSVKESFDHPDSSKKFWRVVVY